MQCRNTSVTSCIVIMVYPCIYTNIIIYQSLVIVCVHCKYNYYANKHKATKYCIIIIIYYTRLKDTLLHAL